MHNLPKWSHITCFKNLKANVARFLTFVLPFCDSMFKGLKQT